jgi:uncharacterized membrane protein YphA (DoxX/SURF4 family)
VARGGSSAIALRVLAIALGIFFLGMAANKVAWLMNSNLLLERFQRWAPMARPSVKWYLEHVCIPGAPIFARLVPLGELATAIALIVGVWPRVAATLALLMVLNFHFATSSFWAVDFLRDGTGPPVIGALLALAIGGARLPWTVRG